MTGTSTTRSTTQHQAEERHLMNERVTVGNGQHLLGKVLKTSYGVMRVTLIESPKPLAGDADRNVTLHLGRKRLVVAAATEVELAPAHETDAYDEVLGNRVNWFTGAESRIEAQLRQQRLGIRISAIAMVALPMVIVFLGHLQDASNLGPAVLGAFFIPGMAWVSFFSEGRKLGKKMNANSDALEETRTSLRFSRRPSRQLVVS